jgi:DNA-binding beta-propeller fold protein YncE
MVGSPAGEESEIGDAMRGSIRVAVRVSLLVLTLGALLTPIASARFVPVVGSPFHTGDDPQSLAFSPKGDLLAVANCGCFGDHPGPTLGHTLSMFRVTAPGQLRAVAGSPFPTGLGPTSVAYRPGGTVIAVTNSVDNDVSVFRVNSGRLSPVPGSPFPTGFDPQSVAFNPNGTLLAVGNGDSSVWMYSVARNGGLTPVTGTPFPILDFNALSVAFSTDGRLLAVAQGFGSSVETFTVSATGFLTGVGEFPTGSGPAEVVFNPLGRFLVVPSDFGDVVPSQLSVFGIRHDGTLVPTGGSPYLLNRFPNSAGYSTDADLLAVTVGDRDGDVRVFGVGTDDGLSPVGVVHAGEFSEPTSVEFAPFRRDKLFAVANTNTGSVAVFVESP